MRRRRSRVGCCACMLFLAAALPLLAQATEGAAAPRDGSRDFDFEFGRWHTRLRRLEAPLSGKTRWIEWEGTTTVRGVRGGKVELEVTGKEGAISGLSLRLYGPQARQWSLNYATARSGQMLAPVYGAFERGRGEFYGADTLDKRAILVRFVVVPVDADTIRFEQSFSGDGGRHWELNWMATDTRLPD